MATAACGGACLEIDRTVVVEAAGVRCVVVAVGTVCIVYMGSTGSNDCCRWVAVAAAAGCCIGQQVNRVVDVVDMGVNHEFPDMAGLVKRKVRPGSANMANGPAMSQEDALQALLCGAELATEAYEAGCHLLGTGEMGIANTTPATALYAVLLDVPVESITGRGTGIDDERLSHKISVIKRAIAVNASHCTTPFGTLAALGGYEIAAITGFILGAAAARVPVVVDGFISSAAAVVAIKLCPAVDDYLFFSHLSNEQGHRAVMQKLGVRPILDLDLRLGEGTGAAIAMQLVEGAIKIYNEMATFSAASVSEKSED